MLKTIKRIYNWGENETGDKNLNNTTEKTKNPCSIERTRNKNPNKTKKIHIRTNAKTKNIVQ
jgi:hypothetical protein